MSENIVKSTCKDLGITYRELGKAIGYDGNILSNIASTGKVSEQLRKAIELYRKTLELAQENQQLKNEMKTIAEARAILKKYI